MAREPRRTLTVEEARNLPPPTEEELAERRAALDAAYEAALQREREGRGITLEGILAALDETRGADWSDLDAGPAK